MDTDLQRTKTSRMWCICGFACSQKHSSQMISESLWMEVTNMWKS